MKRTHYCGEVTKNDIGKNVTVVGWVNKRRDHGNLIFIDLRDRTGIVQIVFNPEANSLAHQIAHTVRSEFVIMVTGNVVARTPENVNPNLATGEIEISASQIMVLNESKPTPFVISEDSEIAEDLRMKYRYLDLRRPSMQKNILLRHKITYLTREYLYKNGFIEIETPMLTKRTPEGARDYLVPSRVHPGMFYALPQSPQMFKQLCMVAGFDKYYQVVRCFRDEDLRADRQPEFTQIDIEMSFVEPQDIYAVVEGLIAYIMEHSIGVKIPTPFPRYTYDEAMNLYGSDKPDIRFGLTFVNLSSVVANSEFKVFSDTVHQGGEVKGIKVPNADSISRSELDKISETSKTFGAKGIIWFRIKDNEIQSSVKKLVDENTTKAIIEKMDAKVGDLLILIADKHDVVSEALCKIRLDLGEKLKLIDEKRFDFLWVTDFPLLEWSEDEKKFVAKHHPFTSPKDEDVHLLDTPDAHKIKAKAYDLVLNGSELGGGSIRIHRREVQQKMFKTLQLTDEEAHAKFGFLMEAFEYGAPPHGGIALGLDRIVSLFTGTKNIRDVIPFPKTLKATCLMTSAPSEVEEKLMKELHIKVV